MRGDAELGHEHGRVLLEQRNLVLGELEGRVPRFDLGRGENLKRAKWKVAIRSGKG